MQAKALEDWSYTLAMQAATWGSPAVITCALRDHDATGPNAKAQPNGIWRMENTSTPELAEKAGYVLPNLSVIYGFGFLDLGHRRSAAERLGDACSQRRGRLNYRSTTCGLT